MQLELIFNHHTILVRADEGPMLEKLRDEFHYFLGSPVPGTKTLIKLQLGSLPAIPSMVASKHLENAVIYRLGHRQYIDYFGEALTVWDRQSQTMEIYALQLDRLYELAFLAVHSILGEQLDLQGYCRLHALGISRKKVNALIMLPSKGGKSTLLQSLIEHPEVKIISDDTPLVTASGAVWPFPSKISLERPPQGGSLKNLTWHEFKRHHYPPKWTASLSGLKEKISADCATNKTLLVAGYRLSSGKSFYLKVSKWKMPGPLFEHMIIGMGLPQILEIFLSFDWGDYLKMIKHAYYRSLCAFQLLRKAECYELYLGPDLEHNSNLVLDMIHEHQDS